MFLQRPAPKSKAQQRAPLDAQVDVVLSKMKRAPRTVQRGRQKGPTLGHRDAQGTLHYPAVTGDKNKLYNIARRLKRSQHTVVGLQTELAGATEQEEQAVERERKRSRKHTEVGAVTSAANVAISMAGQHTNCTNYRAVDATRNLQDLDKWERGLFPESTAVKRKSNDLAMGMVEALRPLIDESNVSFPVNRLIALLINQTGWAIHGIAKDPITGLFDLVRAVVLWIAITCDGASMMENGRGYLLEALKAIGYDVTRWLSGRAAAEPTDEDSEGHQSARACILSGMLAGTGNYENNFDLSGENFKRLAYYATHPFIHPRIGLASVLNVALPQDMSSIWKYTGLGAGSLQARLFCPYCCCIGDNRGMPAYSRCSHCRRVDPEEQFPCCHHDMVEGHVHAAAAPLADAHNSAEEVRELCLALDTAARSSVRLAKDVSAAARKAVKLCNTASVQTGPFLQRAPVVTQLAQATSKAAASISVCLDACHLAVQAVTLEARVALAAGSTTAQIMAHAVVSLSTTKTAAETAATALSDTYLCSALTLAAREETAAMYTATARPGPAPTELAGECVKGLVKQLLKMADMVQAVHTAAVELCKASHNATTAVGAVPRSWAGDIGSVLFRPDSDHSQAHRLLSFARDTLKIDFDRDARPIADCTIAQLKVAIMHWYDSHDAHPENIGTLKPASVQAQLRARFLDEATMQDWLGRHMDLAPGVDPAHLDRREVLLAVLQFADRLELCMQRRSHTTTSFVNDDGSPLVHSYLREVELFVMCILHAYMRVGEKLVNLLLGELKTRTDISKVEAQRRWVALRMGINQVLHPPSPDEEPESELDTAPPSPTAQQSDPPSPASTPEYDTDFMGYLGDTFGPQRDKAPKGRRADAAQESCVAFPDFNSSDCRFRMDGNDQKKLWANFGLLLNIGPRVP
ncbi:hypothetical protein B484DRAFT_399487 [Ochromonadaceae sp. CCMP2298]|nr:hypothetical protein B484DRAFT_399487 [Ochromonadaceae sp. CCMP2298]